MLDEIGLTDVVIVDPVDTFAGSAGEVNARAFDVHGYPFLAHEPTGRTR